MSPGTTPPAAVAERDPEDLRAELRDLERRRERAEAYNAGKLDGRIERFDEQRRASSRRSHLLLEVACWLLLLAAGAVAVRETMKTSKLAR